VNGWIAQIKRSGLSAAAGVARMSRRGRHWAPCPACGAEKRGANDGRAPVGTSEGGGWKCHACQVSGDAADLVAYAVAGARLSELDPDARERVRLASAEAGLCTETDADEPPRPRTLSSSRTSGHDEPVRRPRRGRPAPQPDVRGPEDPFEHNPNAAASGRPPAWTSDLCERAEDRLWADEAAEPVRRYLLGGIGEGPGGSDGRRLPEQTIRDFHLGALEHDGWWWVVLPLLDPSTGDPTNVKLRRVPAADGSCPKPKYTTCGRRPLTLFGERSLTNDLDAPVVVVEGEFDVLAFWAYGYRGSVVSGTAGAGSFDEAWLDVLEPYQSFVLAYDVEESGIGEEGADNLAEKLGRSRCSRAELPRKDASDCWLHAIAETEIERAIDRAKPYVGLEVHRCGHWASAIEQQIANPTSLRGLPTGSAILDKLIGGWPVGLTVVTGGTKTGKSALTIWALREQALMGVPVLLTGFENGIGEVQQRLLRQQLRGDFTTFTAADRARAFAELDRMPIFNVDDYGTIKLDDFIQTVLFHKRRNGIKAVLVDHIGFFVDLGRRDLSETQQLQHAIRQLVILGKNEGIAVLAIAHPDKKAESEGRRVRIADIRGTIAAQQDCALGLGLEKDAKIEKAAVPGQAGIWVHVDAMRSMFARGGGSKGFLWYDDRAGLYADDWDRLPCASAMDPDR
jgi:hypothetical protein